MYHVGNLMMNNCFLQDGTTPLHLGCQNGHVDLCKVLIEVNASINAIAKVSHFSLVSKKDILARH